MMLCTKSFPTFCFKDCLDGFAWNIGMVGGLWFLHANTWAQEAKYLKNQSIALSILIWLTCCHDILA